MVPRPNCAGAPFLKSLSNQKSAQKSILRPRSHPILQFHFLTLFPEIFSSGLDASLLGKAVTKGIVSYQFTQIRDFTKDKHRTVDGSPYGGGEGMLLKADVLYDAWRSALPRKQKGATTILLSPQGTVLTQKKAQELASFKKLVLVCGHYEGVDERFIDLCVDQEISIGNYVLTGGELPALVLADVVTRLLPGVVGNARSLSEESLEKGLLKYPQYTRPRSFRGKEVPPILLGGDHQAIRAWREAQRIERTRRKRPDLLEP